LLQLPTELLITFEELKVGLAINLPALCQMETVFCHQLLLR
jgi:hypothetical protein